MTDGGDWAVRSICADCLTSDLGRRILSGAVGIASIRSGPVERCVLCGWPFADQTGEAHPNLT